MILLVLLSLVAVIVALVYRLGLNLGEQRTLARRQALQERSGRARRDLHEQTLSTLVAMAREAERRGARTMASSGSAVVPSRRTPDGSRR